eukprot:354809-Alexandrium_andersonii.AAC.1
MLNQTTHTRKDLSSGTCAETGLSALVRRKHACSSTVLRTSAVFTRGAANVDVVQSRTMTD